MKKIISVVGARPNFMKIGPLHRAFLPHSDMVMHMICHTGQHFDENMSRIFFEELELPQPDFYLGVGSGSHAEQTARIMTGFEKVLMDEKPDLVVVPGDVNSTMAASLVASKMGIPIAHIEAGLRSFDRTMPEEINRMVTDVLAEYLFVSEPSGLANLRKEGIPEEKTYPVGNIMIDSLTHYLPKTEKSTILKNLELRTRDYVLVTFHRPNNVDLEIKLTELVNFLNRLSESKKVIFPVHPRTRINLEQYGLISKLESRVILTEPMGYIDFLTLTRHARLVITDSGGIQEETTWLGVPCITVRDNTERPVTVDQGTNVLAGTDLNRVQKLAGNMLEGKTKKGKIPEYWDGKTANRIVQILLRKL
ncbi:MAG TPA: UDP-N-acetylglucosamine 2-epimerase (non-hydrolyzing) [Bacteroidetes bacterium]|nr:UDP-N-acetylglucosamine 2-epimerase (non-hydrolyzing) [Bacteroidota bacterium]